MRPIVMACVALLAAAACSEVDDPAQDGDVPRQDSGADASTTPTPDAGGGLTTACPVKGYKPCGGKLEGTWTFVDLCPEDQAKADALFEHPYDNLTPCKDRTKNFVIAAWNRDGTMAFSGGKVAVKMKTSVDINYGFTDACLTAAKPAEATPKAACAAMEKPGKLACVYETAKGCTCKGNVKAPDEDTTSDYTASGQTFTVGKDVATYCVDNKVLIFDFEKHPISWRYWILKR